MKKTEFVLIKIALAISSMKIENEIIHGLLEFCMNRYDLVGGAHGVDIDMDIAKFQTKYECLRSRISEFDMAFFDFAFLQANARELGNLYRKNPRCQMIIVGNNARDIYLYLDVRPCGFLKADDEIPFSDNRQLNRLCLLASADIRENDEIFQLVTKSGVYSLNLNEVLYCKSDLKYIVITTADGKEYRKIGKLSDFSEILPPRFVRIHQSFLINRSKLQGIDKSTHEVIMEGNIRLPFSNTYREVALGLF